MTRTDPAVPPALHRPAGVVTRLLAAAVDTASVGLALAALYLGVAGLLFVWSPTTFGWPSPAPAFSALTAGLVATAYLTVSWATTGRTYGSSLLGLRVLSGRRDLLGWARAALRAVLCVVFPFGLLWAAISGQRRSVHDVVVRSIVVYDWHLDRGAHVRAAEPG